MKELGIVTAEESTEIRELMGRKGALENLFLTLGRIPDGATDMTANELYEKIVRDLQDVSSKIDDWWQRTSQKYAWKYTSGDIWRIDFLTNTVCLQ